MSDKRDHADLPNEAFEPIRKRVDIQVGKFVKSGNAVYRIAQVLDFESVIGIEVESGRSVPLRIGDLSPADSGGDKQSAVDISEIADEDWKIAEKRFAAIKPLVNEYHLGRREVERRAKEVGVNTATLYRWLKKYKAFDTVPALIPRKRGWKPGNIRIPAFAEDVIKEVIRDFFLTSQRPTATKAVVQVRRLCEQRGIDLPSPSTIRARLSKVSERDSLRGRGFKEKAKNKFLPAAGSFPNADFPLAVVQIDHTPADIILVDDVYRRPIGRPWITLAIDVHSRVVTGYYLAFDAPSENSVAMCVAHSMIPKEEWLLLHKVDAKWPVWGVPKTIHVDNGPDFQSNNFKQSCLTYGIHLEYRPVKQPKFGGHIERLNGTLLREIHDLPGTTFASIKAKEGYDSEKHATMTISEFEQWLVTLICKVYHQRLHTGIGMSPMRKWEIGIFGNAAVQGIGVPPRPADRLTILLDFLPSFRRTVQTFGVTIEGMNYYAEALRPWINATEPDKQKQKRELVFRRDRRDISSIWFFDPTLKQYFKIPFANQSLPPMSAWEHEQAKELLRKEGVKEINEHQILRSITELRVLVDGAKEKTKTARRQAQRRKEHAKLVTPAAPMPAVKKEKVEDAPRQTVSDLVDGDIDAFGEIS